MENLILRCMALSKADRPHSVAEIQEKLAEPDLQEGKADDPAELTALPSQAPEENTPPPATKPGKPSAKDGKKKNEYSSCLWTALIVVVIAALAIVGIISIIKGISGNKPALTETPGIEEPSLTPAPTKTLETPIPTRAPVTPVPTETPLPPTPTEVSLVPPDCTSVGQEWVSPVDGQTLVCVPAGSFRDGNNRKLL